MKIDTNNSDSDARGDFRITRRIELNFWRTCLLNAAGLLLAWLTSDAIEFNNIFSFAFLVVMIWFLNWIIKPILVVFTFCSPPGSRRRHNRRFVLGSAVGVFSCFRPFLGACDGAFREDNQGGF